MYVCVYFSADKSTGESRGFAFVYFHDSNSTDAAVAMSGESVRGRGGGRDRGREGQWDRHR